MKKVLITGAGSYIGEKVREYLMQTPEEYLVCIRDTIGWNPTVTDFDGVDVVFNVAGIAHIKETEKNEHLYFEVNRDLVVRIAEVAKAAGVKQFILLSTMSVYGKVVGHIKKETLANPVNAYGKSKAEADEIIETLSDENFRFCCLRPPMVYGKNCKGNYQRLRRITLKSPIFLNYKNQRSMIYIGNLCEFVKDCIDHDKSGLFFPQNREYVNTSEMVQLIAKENKKNVLLVNGFGFLVRIAPFSVVKKVFGNLTYEKTDVIGKYSFEDSIKLTEN